MAKPRKSLIPLDLMASPAAASAGGRGPELPSPAPVRQAPGGGIKSSTSGTTVYLLPHELKRLRMLALTTDRSLHALILDGIDLVLAKDGQPPLERYKARTNDRYGFDG
jgi:hypothetical protein